MATFHMTTDFMSPPFQASFFPINAQTILLPPSPICHRHCYFFIADISLGVAEFKVAESGKVEEQVCYTACYLKEETSNGVPYVVITEGGRVDEDIWGKWEAVQAAKGHLVARGPDCGKETEAGTEDTGAGGETTGSFGYERSKEQGTKDEL